MNKKELYIISKSYPFLTGEEFVKKELIELKKYFSKIVLFPLTSDNNKMRWMPEGVELNTALTATSRYVPPKYFLINVFLLLNILGIEFIKSQKKITIIKNLRELANSILQAKILSEKFISELHNVETICFYSIWMDDGALMLSILKSQNKIPDFFFRLHGYDLFDERRVGNYMPFRYYNFKNVKKIFILSQAGYDYIYRKNIFREKLHVIYSGLYDNGINPFNANSIFTLVSCSNFYPVKRIDKIVGSLSFIKFPIRWIHFGDGKVMDEVKTLASKLPENIEVVFKGNVDNDELMKFYSTTSVNLFIHLSDSEGLGMAIVEAQSFGIPTLAADVGGIVNVVNEETGILVAADLPLNEIAKQITGFVLSEKNTFAYRTKVKQYCEKHFDAETNYKLLFKNIIE